MHGKQWKKLHPRTSMFYLAGSVSGMLFAIVSIIASQLGAPKVHAAIFPESTWGYFYSMGVWGGIWSLVFYIPLMPRFFHMRGVLLSLIPAVVMLMIELPVKNAGILGLNLGPTTPIFIIAYWALWGFLSAVIIRASERRAGEIAF